MPLKKAVSHHCSLPSPCQLQSRRMNVPVAKLNWVMFWVKIKHPQHCRPLLFNSIHRVCYDLHGAAAWAPGSPLPGPYPAGCLVHLVLLPGMPTICTHMPQTPNSKKQKNIYTIPLKIKELKTFPLGQKKKSHHNLHFPVCLQCLCLQLLKFQQIIHNHHKWSRYSNSWR